MFQASSLEAAKPEHISFPFPNCDPLRQRLHAPSNPPVSAFTAPHRCPASPGRPWSSWICGNSRPPPGRHSTGLSGKGLAQNPASQPLPSSPLHSAPQTSYVHHDSPRGLEVQQDIGRRLIHLPPISLPPTQLHRASVFTSHPPPETCQAPPLWSLSPRDAALPQSKASSRNHSLPWTVPFHIPSLPGHTTPHHPVIQIGWGKAILCQTTVHFPTPG